MASKSLIAKVSHNLFPFPICLGAAENVGRERRAGQVRTLAVASYSR